MYNLIFKQFIRSRAVVITVILILMMGIVSIFIGKQFLLKEELNIAQVTHHQQDHIQRNVNHNQDNIGGLLYYVRFSLVNKLDKLTALSIGQRDINPGVQRVTIRNLEAQKYDTDLNNPANLVSGNLDLGFVIIYLFPLVIIAFTFNLQSEESESGTWRMVAVQSKSILGFLSRKLFTRALLIYSILLALFVFAIIILSLPLNASLFAFILLSMLYLAFWFGFSFWIISFQRSSNFNALLLLTAWVTLAIILPAGVNNFVSNQYPVPESLSTLIKQRDGYHRKWDEHKEKTMEKFYQHYPQFKKYGIPKDDFSYAWYYAMQQMGDDESSEDSEAMRDKILKREEASRFLSLVIPTMHVQLLFNDLAGTSLQHHLNFLDQTDDFHEKLRLHFYPKIFENSPVMDEDWKSFKPEYAIQKFTIPWITLVGPILIITFLLLILAITNMRKSNVLF